MGLAGNGKLGGIPGNIRLMTMAEVRALRRRPLCAAARLAHHQDAINKDGLDGVVPTLVTGTLGC